jgi:hypothetical protein
MKFAMVKIIGSKNRDHSHSYSSTFMEMGASPKWTTCFDSEDEMIAAVMLLLAKQKQPDGLNRVLNQIKNGGYYFFDLDLTAKEAAFLGYPNINAPILNRSQRSPTLTSAHYQRRYT